MKPSKQQIIKFAGEALETAEPTLTDHYKLILDQNPR